LAAVALLLALGVFLVDAIGRSRGRRGDAGAVADVADVALGAADAAPAI
jgi:hypothetical protein